MKSKYELREIIYRQHYHTPDKWAATVRRYDETTGGSRGANGYGSTPRAAIRDAKSTWRWWNRLRKREAKWEAKVGNGI